MTATPAGELARLKIAYPAWRFTRTLPGAPGPGFIAVERATGRRVMAATVGALEAAVVDAPQDGAR